GISPPGSPRSREECPALARGAGIFLRSGVVGRSPDRLCVPPDRDLVPFAPARRARTPRPLSGVLRGVQPRKPPLVDRERPQRMEEPGGPRALAGRGVEDPGTASVPALDRPADPGRLPSGAAADGELSRGGAPFDALLLAADRGRRGARLEVPALPAACRRGG